MVTTIAEQLQCMLRQPGRVLLAAAAKSTVFVTRAAAGNKVVLPPTSSMQVGAFTQVQPQHTPAMQVSSLHCSAVVYA
jgi:hypothetical protein